MANPMCEWKDADGGPETSAKDFMHRDHCQIVANAKLFRKEPSATGDDGKFDRTAKRPGRRGPRKSLLAFLRIQVQTSSFNQKQQISSENNANAMRVVLHEWKQHWFWGAILTTDSS